MWQEIYESLARMSFIVACVSIRYRLKVTTQNFMSFMKVYLDDKRFAVAWLQFVTLNTN